MASDPPSSGQQEARNLLADRVLSKGLGFLLEMSKNEYLDTNSRNSLLQRHAEVSRQAAQDRLRLAVVGEFSAGKSTLINALLGTDVLASDIEPTTAVQTRLTWGPVFQVDILGTGGNKALWHRLEASRDVTRQILRYRLESKENTFLQPDGALNPLARGMVSDFVRKATTEQELEAGVNEVVIQLPSSYLSAAIDVIDTPGFNPGLSDADYQRHLDVTMSAVESSHLAVFVIDGRNPLKSTEQKFLQAFKPFLSRIFFVVNKMDMLFDDDDDEEAIDAQEYINEELPSKFDVPVEQTHIYFVSSAQKLDGAAQKYGEALVSLREDVVSFMEKSRELILIERAARYLGSCVSDVGKRTKKRFNSANERIQKLNALKITDVESIKERVLREGLRAFRDEAASMLGGLQDREAEARKASLTEFTRYISTIEKKKWIAQCAGRATDSVYEGWYAKPLHKAIIEGLVGCIDAALEAMATHFVTYYDAIDIPQPERPGEQELRQVARSIIEHQVHGTQVAATLDKANKRGSGIMKAGLIAGAIIGGPVGIGLAGAGAAIKLLFGASKAELQSQAVDQFEQKLLQAQEHFFKFAEDCVLIEDTTAGPESKGLLARTAESIGMSAKVRQKEFRGLLEHYQQSQIDVFRSRVDELITKTSAERQYLQTAMSVFHLANDQATVFVEELEQSAKALRDELGHSREWGQASRQLILDQEALDSISESMFGAVANGAADLPARTNQWCSGTGACVKGAVKDSHRDAIYKSSALVGLIGVVFTNKASDSRWCKIVHEHGVRLGLKPTDLALLTPSFVTPKSDPPTELLANLAGNVPPGKPLTYSKLKEAESQLKLALNEIQESHQYWRECIPEELAGKQQYITNAVAQRTQIEVLQIRRTLRNRLFLKIAIAITSVGTLACVAWYALQNYL